MSPHAWSDAPADLLWRIIQRLPIADYIRFGAVCVSWRSALSERRRPPAPQVPFLLLSHHDSTFHFFSLPENKRHRYHLPDTGATIGSSGGWIITTHGESSPILLLNPFSPSTHLRLPPVTTLRTAATEDMSQDYFRKLVISSDTAAVIFNRSSRLAFARVGDSSWTTVNSHNVKDILFFKDKLYAVYCFGKVATIDLSRPTFNVNAHLPNDGRLDLYKHSHNYLVVSSRGDLLQVLRWMGLGYRGGCLSTRLFRVFKMVKPLSWIELESLGDDALFLGHGSHGHSLALSAKDFPEVRRNCIYFTDNHQIQENGHSKCDLRVFDMEDQSLEVYCSCEYQTSRLPVWFPPMAAAAPPQQ